MKLRLLGRRQGSTHEERPPTSAGSAASPSSEESPATSPGPDPTPATSGTSHADLDITWVKRRGEMRSWSHSGVQYVVFGERAGQYFLGINTAGVKEGGTLDLGPYQTLEDCKARIRQRLDDDVRTYGVTSSD